MNEETPPPASRPPVSMLMVVLGLLFIASWLGVAVMLGFAKFMGVVMANDSGAASNEQHMTLIGGVMGGQLLTGIAGIPAGLAFFWRSWRRGLLWIFGLLLVAGVVLQVAAIRSFF
ncbi:MAG: hypothetical protein JNG86_02680 [Verrucomicrobiaceae bacterium]|nr:hypothetical protein [Verrucomicrobiaceae bacterium]